MDIWSKSGPSCTDFETLGQLKIVLLILVGSGTLVLPAFLKLMATKRYPVNPDDTVAAFRYTQMCMHATLLSNCTCKIVKAAQNPHISKC